MSKHTKGPWLVSARNPKEVLAHNGIQEGNGSEYIFIADTSEQNARLIAAAPELLRFAKLMETYFANNLDGYGDLRQECHEAIAKAEGES